MYRVLRLLVVAALLGTVCGCSGSKDTSPTHPATHGTSTPTQPAGGSAPASQKDNTHLPG